MVWNAIVWFRKGRHCSKVMWRLHKSGSNYFLRILLHLLIIDDAHCFLRFPCQWQISKQKQNLTLYVSVSIFTLFSCQELGDFSLLGGINPSALRVSSFKGFPSPLYNLNFNLALIGHESIIHQYLPNISVFFGIPVFPKFLACRFEWVFYLSKQKNPQHRADRQKIDLRTLGLCLTLDHFDGWKWS